MAPGTAALLLVAGCQVDGQDQDDASLTANRDRAVVLGERWRELPDVTRVQVRYVDDLDNSPGLTAHLRCSGCDVRRTADEVTRAVWTSDLDPLQTITVAVQDERDAARRTTVSYVLPDDEATLVRRFGAREDPSTTSAEDDESPSPPSATARERQRRPPVTRLLVVGDIMLGRRVAVPGRPVAPLRFMARRIRSADLAVGNLESTLSDDGPPQQGGDSFAAPPGTLAGLERIGFDAMSLANNHTGDFGVPAMLESLRRFRSSTITAFGAGRDLTAASRPAVLEHDGTRFGFVGFNAIGETPRATPRSAGALSVRMPPRTGPLRRDDLEHVLRAVRRLERRVDVVVVLPHWGTQYTHVAEPVQSRVGRALGRAGADLVVGGHPHWVQGLEPVGEAVIAHSLGNFVFDMDFMEQTMEGVTLTATFRGDRLVQVELDAYRMGADFAPRPLRGAAARSVVTEVRAQSRGRFRRSAVG